jgi:hypothetical protein
MNRHSMGVVWKVGLTAWLILALMSPARGGAAQEKEGVKAAGPEVQEEAAEKKPEKPPEKKPPELPGYLAEPKAAAQPPTTLEIGALTGILAPYGYSTGLDTLTRGWQSHRLGPVRFFPFLEFEETYRSNIYGTTGNKKADFINGVNPGMRFELPLAQRHKISLGYLGNYYFYSTFDQNNHYDHNLNLDAAFNFPQGLALRGGSTLRIATEDRTATNGYQRDYNRVTPYFQAAYKMADRWKIETNYQEDSLIFLKKRDWPSDFNAHNAAATLFYKFWPKTAVMWQYIFTYRQHPHNYLSDNYIHTPLMGLSFDPTAKISGTLKFGYTFQQFEHSVPNRSKSDGDFSLSIQTQYRYSRYTNFNLVAQRAIQEDPDSANNSYVNTGFLFSISHLWHYFNIASYANFAYYNNRYVSIQPEGLLGILKRRIDNIYSAGCGLSVPLTKYFKAKVEYVYYNRGSNFYNINYNDHRVIFGVQASY